MIVTYHILVLLSFPLLFHWKVEEVPEQPYQPYHQTEIMQVEAIFS